MLSLENWALFSDLKPAYRYPPLYYVRRSDHARLCRQPYVIPKLVTTTPEGVTADKSIVGKGSGRYPVQAA